MTKKNTFATLSGFFKQHHSTGNHSSSGPSNHACASRSVPNSSPLIPVLEAWQQKTFHSLFTCPVLPPHKKKSSLLSLRTVVVKRKLTTRYFHWVEFYLKIYIKFKSLSRSLRLLILCINSKPSINIISVTSALFHNFDLLSMSLTNQFHFTFIITKAIPFTDLSSDLLV